jgi:hypothetical protein
MNAPVDLQQIELARLSCLAEREAQALVELSDERDTVTTIENGWVNMVFTGRGSKQIGLSLPDSYSIVTRINYLADTLKRLTQIKNYILECAA